ncbi:MAG: four helix bundle protein [Nitrospirae bacterium]|nr:four helix bundle protein [Nitrospirota bacterium]
MKATELKERTKRFSICIVRLFRLLPRTEEARVIGQQLLRSGTAVAANYRATCRARSRAEFIAKIGVVVEEADETIFWLELLEETSIVPQGSAQELIAEADELLAIFAASQVTAKKKN